MLDFMIIGLPRSGTTWAANCLTTNDTFCLHDPCTNCIIQNGTQTVEKQLKDGGPLIDLLERIQ